MKTRNFIGIDVSKDTLDICVLYDGREVKELKIKNTTRDISKHLGQLKKDGFITSETLFCMEYTGIYNNLLLTFFEKNSCLVWMESGVQIKLSSGMTRGKSDKVDARRIAHYAFKNQHQAKLWSPKREVVVMLQTLLKSRERLLKVKKQLNSVIQENKRFVVKALRKLNEQINRKPIQEIEKAILKVEKEIEDLIRSDVTISKQYALAKSVSGVGPIIAATMIAKTNEFKNFSQASKFACQAGVVPFEHSSGKSVRGKTRVSHMADKSIKALLHLAAMAVIKKSGEMKEYYDRKVNAGKNKMSVINAIRNKIVKRIFAVIKRGTPYQKFNNLSLG